MQRMTWSADWRLTIADRKRSFEWLPAADSPIVNSKSSLVNSNTVQLYEYSVYGQVAASDPNHPNPFLFTGRRFDTDTGLYYYRARYYNPYIGRFLQTDPIGYGDGMNPYRYCRNNPVAYKDPIGTYTFTWFGPVPVGGPPSSPPPLISPDAPWYSAPWTIDRGKPDYPGKWQISDFFGWYRYGDGMAVNLEKVGLLGRFRRAVRVHEAVIEWVAKRQASMFAVETYLAGKNGGDTRGYEDSFHHDFAPSKPVLGFRMLIGDPLVVLGDCDVSAWIILSAEQNDPKDEYTYRWAVDITFTLNDEFTDPTDYFDRTPDIIEDWAYCQAYAIVGQWNYQSEGLVDVRSGRVTLPGR
jgi:RHS repeat-associated protein